MTTYPVITTLIPHRPPMLLVDEILNIAEKTGSVQAHVAPNHLFLREDGTLAPEVFCELIAQSFGACEAYRRLQKNLGLDVGGYLASIRNLQIKALARQGNILTVYTEQLDECFGTYIVHGEICSGTKSLAQATIYVFMWEGKEPPKTI